MKGKNDASTRTHQFWSRPQTIAALLLVVLVSVAGLGRVLAQSPLETTGGTPASGAGIDADALRDFEALLVQAFVDNDSALLSEMLAPEFRYAIWGGDNRVVAPDEVIDLVDSVLVGPASAPAFQESVGIREIEAIVGEDPLVLWGEDLPVVSVLLISGLVDTGAGEALLAIAPDAAGLPVWTGMLVAEEGLPAAPAPDAEDASAATEESAGETAVEDTAAEDTPAEDTPAGPGTIVIESISLEATPAFVTRSATLDGEHPAAYLVRAEAGQALTIDLAASSEDASFIVLGERNRQEYKGADNPARVWTLTVPATQEYRIVIDAPEPALYILTLLVSPVGHRLPPPEPGSPDALANAAAQDKAAAATGDPESGAAQTESAESMVAPERIRFGVGETSALRNGAVLQGERKEYVLRVLGGQTLNIDIASENDAANFAVTGMRDGQPYKRLENEARAFSMTAPSTQDYLISIATGSEENAPTNYTLFVNVPAASAPTPTPAYAPIEPVANPERIRLSVGSTGTSLDGMLGAYGTDGYLLAAEAGQIMFVRVDSPESIARFSISGYDDGVVLKPVNGETAWQGLLPATQDYLVQIENDRGVRVQYELTVEFSPLQASPPTNPAPTNTPVPMPTPVPTATSAPQPPAQPPAQRIIFPPGAISASMNGFITPNEVQTYVLAARAGQTMTAVVSSLANDVGLTITGADGTPYKRASVGGSGFAFTLPLSQDYYISAVGMGSATTYTLSVIIVN